MWNSAAEFLALPEVELLAEPSGLDGKWASFANGDRSSPNRWTDTYLAAFALSGGMRLVTFDKAFSGFDGLDCLIL